MTFSQTCVSMLFLSGITINIRIAQTCFIFPITLKNNRREDKSSIQHLVSEVSSGVRQMERRPILNLEPSVSIYLFYCWSVKRITTYKWQLPQNEKQLSATVCSFYKHFAKWWALVTTASHWRLQSTGSLSADTES